MALLSPIPFPTALPRPLPGWPRRRWWRVWLFAVIPLGGQQPPYDRSTEAACATDGQIEAFEHFFRQFEPRIAGYLWRMTGDEQTANDLSQETFLRAWEHFTEISTYPVPQSWLFRVATNLALSHLRRRAAPVGAAVPLPEDLAGLSPDPIAQIGERDHVLQTLFSMPPKQRALLVLREVYGFSTEEAGRVMGISVVAARRLLSRAYQHFRQSYLRKEDKE